MIRYKRGNATTMILPIIFMMLIVIIVAFVFIYIQISIYLYDVKLNTFYIVQSSIAKEDYENLVFRDYTLNEDRIKDNINSLFERNYLRVSEKKKGIVDIECIQLKIIKNKSEVIEHTKNKYYVPVICIKYRLVFNPLLSVLGNDIEVDMHDDIKLSLLKFD